jgi:hypothetical protein
MVNSPVLPKTQSLDTPFGAAQPQDSSGAHPYPQQESQGHPQEYRDNDGNGQERDVKKEGTHTPEQQQSAESDHADFDHIDT